MAFYQRYVFPWILDKVMQHPRLMQLRHELLAGVQGEVLEIGFGTGLNTLAYPHQGLRLHALDVNPGVARRARQRLRKFPLRVEHATLDGQSLPFADESFDVVVSTWTLCSIPDVARALAEIHRVLRRDGTFLYVEHGLHGDAAVARWQHRLTPVQKRLGDGCHLDRDIDALLRAAGFDTSDSQRFSADGLPALFGYMYQGRARRQDSPQRG